MNYATAVSSAVALTFAFFLCVVWATEHDIGLKDGGFSLEFIIDRDKPLTAGAPVVGYAKILNASDRPLQYADVDTGEDFQVEVTRHGKPAAATDYARWLMPTTGPQQIVSRTTVRLRPGEARWYPIEISRRADMTLPGEYAVVIRRTVPKEKSTKEYVVPSGEVSSKPVSVFLEEPQSFPISTTRPSDVPAVDPADSSGSTNTNHR